MRVDVVACYYKQERYAPLFLLGMVRNQSVIDKVFIVNDEPWTKGEVGRISDLSLAMGLTRPLVFLAHPHERFGISRSFNQGVFAATTQFVFLMAFDMMLNEGCVEVAETKPGILLTSQFDTVDTRRGDLYPGITRNRWQQNAALFRQWLTTPSGHMLLDRKAFLEIGGFAEFGEYGYDDHEFVVRWMIHCGIQSVQYTDLPPCIHFGEGPSTKLTKKEKERKPYKYASKGTRRGSFESNRMLLRALEGFYGHRYSFSFEHGDTCSIGTVINVGHCLPGKKAKTNSDVYLDCRNPEGWLKEGSAECIVLPPDIFDAKPKKYLKFLAPRGKLYRGKLNVNQN